MNPLLLQQHLVDVDVDLGLDLLLDGHGVEAEPLEGLDLALVLVVDLGKVEVGFGREDGVWNEWEKNIRQRKS